MKEILVLCPFGVDKGLLSKAAGLSGGALRVLIPAGESNIAAEYGASRIFELNAPEIGDESAFAAFLAAVITCVVTGANLLWALWLGIALFAAVGLKRGYKMQEIAAFAWKKGKTSLVVVPVLLLIGTVTGLWRGCGTISYFLYHGLRSISPQWFILMAFLLCAVLSFALGTSFGVVGTGGVVFITMARSGGVSLALTAGAIISGA